MGEVYRARDEGLHREVALKALHAESSSLGVERIDQFLTEARAIARVEHPNVVSVYEVGQADHYYYIAMELVDGSTVEDLCVATGHMAHSRACAIAMEAAEALHALHMAGVIHGDISPRNLMVARSGRCKVTDLGLSHIRESEVGAHRPIAGGTPAYRAPESRAGETLTPAADMFSLGRVVYRMIAGNAPPLPTDPMTMDESITALGRSRPELPAALIEFLRQSTNADPAARPATMKEAAAILRSCII
jgi:serine/threonine protein kinase